MAKTKIVVLFSAAVIAAAGIVLTLRATAAEYPQRTAAEDVLVDAAWLQQNLDNVIILDSARGTEAFLEGHIPGAASVAREVTWDTVDGVSGMLPDPEIVAQDLADAGVSSDTAVVVYDNGNGLWASRLFWALEYLGHSQVHLLDGGVAAWTEAGYSLAQDPVVPERGDFVADPQPLLIADQEYLLEELGNDTLTILDTRSPEEYSGANVRSDRGGHIPGAVNIEWTQGLGDGQSFRPFSELVEVYRDSIEGEEAVTLCQTGVRGAHTYVALRVLGYEQARLYDGSWAEWGNDPDAPVET